MQRHAPRVRDPTADRRPAARLPSVVTHRAHRPWRRLAGAWLGILLTLTAQLALAQGLPDEAAAALARGQRLAAEALLTYPQHFPDQALWAEALAAGREAAAAAPEHPAPQRFLAQAYVTVSWYARAWTHWQSFLELGGTLDAQAARLLLETSTWLGYHAYDQGWGDQARPYLETAVQLDPGNLGAHERLARLALDRGAPEDALVHLEALGDTAEGGALTGDPELLERARVLGLHGLSHDAWRRFDKAGSWAYDIVAPGFKYNMTDIQAALGIHQLRKLAGFHRRRREGVARYSQAFAASPALEPPTELPDVSNSWHLYVLRLRPERLTIGRDAFIEELKARNIGTSVHYRPLHMMSYYAEKYGYESAAFPVARDAFERMLSLPLHPRLSDDDVDDVIDAVLDLVERHAA